MQINELNFLNKDFYLRFENISIIRHPEANKNNVILKDKKREINRGWDFNVIVLGNFFDKRQIWFVHLNTVKHGTIKQRVESFNDLFKFFD
jgi:DNA-binding protein